MWSDIQKKTNQSATVVTRGCRKFTLCASQCVPIPDRLIRLNFWLRRSDNLCEDSHQNLCIHPQVKKRKRR